MKTLILFLRLYSPLPPICMVAALCLHSVPVSAWVVPCIVSGLLGMGCWALSDLLAAWRKC